MRQKIGLWAAGFFLLCRFAHGVTLWSDLGATLAQDTGDGSDILGGAVRRDDTATNTLYFKFHVDPISDVSTEEYYAGFELFEGETRRLAVGNATRPWAYSAFHTSLGDIDLRSSRPESSSLGVFKTYEIPRRGNERTIVFKVEYVAGGDDQVTVWFNPNLGTGANETNQLESLTTKFIAECSFDEIHLRHGGGGGGWIFSDMAIATLFNDFVAGSLELGKAVADSAHGTSPVNFRSWQPEQGLPHGSVRALAQSREGYLWLGGEDGVSRFDGVRFVSFGEREGLRCGSAQVIFEDSSGTLWIGCDNAGLWRGRDGKFAAFTVSGLPTNSITSLVEDGNQRLWVGTPAGVAILQSGKFVSLDNADAIRGKSITALFRDAGGTIWLGAKGAGVFHFYGEKLERVTDAAVEALLLDPHCVLLDRKERLWIGAGDDFILCREGGQWSRHRIPRHLDKRFVNTLAEWPDGTVWAGSVSEGLFAFKDGKFNPVNAGRGLLDNSVQALFVDHEENLWVGTSGGLNQLRPKNLTVGSVPTDATTNSSTSLPPRVILEEVLVDGAPLVSENGKPSNLLRLPPGKHRLEFRYTGLSFVAPERVRFRYRITGLDADWVDAQGRRSVLYSFIPPGAYRFEVIACNADGVWSESAATIAFSIAPYFWQNPLFVGSGALGILALVGVTIRFVEKRRVQARLESLERERTLERERARIAQDLHDDLGASLSRISLLSDMAKAGSNDSAAGENHVDKISQLAGQTLRALDEIVWAVRPGSDSLQSLVDYIAHFANELFKGDGVRCRLDLPEQLPARPLPPEMRHNIFLIAKEALTNALKHSGAHEVTVRAATSADALEISIQDDGKGFDSSNSANPLDGNGLENMRDRAQAIGAALDVQSAPGKGTRVKLRVNFARNGKLSVAHP